MKFILTIEVPDSTKTVLDLVEALEKIEHVQYLSGDEFYTHPIRQNESYEVRNNKTVIGSWTITKDNRDRQAQQPYDV